MRLYGVSAHGNVGPARRASGLDNSNHNIARGNHEADTADGNGHGLQRIRLIIDTDGIRGELRTEDIAGALDSVSVRIEIDGGLGQGEAGRDMYDVKQIDIDNRGEGHDLGCEIYRQRLRRHEVLPRVDDADRGATEEAACVKIDADCPVQCHGSDGAGSLVDLDAHSGQRPVKAWNASDRCRQVLGLESKILGLVGITQINRRNSQRSGRDRSSDRIHFQRKGLVDG